eukprot:11038657-Prorocentrum_lima.AAC.1
MASLFVVLAAEVLKIFKIRKRNFPCSKKLFSYGSPSKYRINPCYSQGRPLKGLGTTGTSS